MSSTITVLYTSKVTVVETFSGATDGDNTATFAPLNEDATFTASTTVPVTKHASFTQALSSGTATIDLTTLPGITADETVNGTGLKVQFLKLINPSTNANKIVASNGASNPYRLDGLTTAWSITLAPGQAVLLELNDAADDVSGSHKTIDLAGTLVQTLSVQIVFG